MVDPTDMEKCFIKMGPYIWASLRKGMPMDKPIMFGATAHFIRDLWKIIKPMTPKDTINVENLYMMEKLKIIKYMGKGYK